VVLGANATLNVPVAAPPAGHDGPRRSLILAGGGMRVAYQAGVVRALLEAGLRFDHADGTSGGTMNLAMLLSGLSAEEMCERWRTLNVNDFVGLLPLRMYARGPAALPALGGAEGVVKHVFPHLGIDVDRIRAAKGLQGTFNVCNYTRKTSEVIRHQDLDLPLLVAGISLPIFMPPVPHNGSLYLDAVWIRDANLSEAVRQGSDEIWVVWCIGNMAEYLDGAFNQYVHMIELSANGNLFKELEQIAELNRTRRPPIRVHLIRPEYPLPLDPEYYKGHIDGATLVDRGYRDAAAYLATKHEGGVPLNPDATRMRDPVPGIALRAALRGSLGGEPCRLDCGVEIDDLDAFLADPAHRARLSGRITAAGIGDQHPATDGEARIGRAIEVDLGFKRDGKVVRLTASGRGTLTARLEAAAGALRLARLPAALSVHATGVHGLGQRLRTLARFWTFLLRGR
jgi:predicted acylesterase/phospholipase RssA